MSVNSTQLGMNIQRASGQKSRDVPRDPTHGRLEFSNVTLGGQAVYDCNVLFNLVEDNIRTCIVRYTNTK